MLKNNPILLLNWLQIQRLFTVERHCVILLSAVDASPVKSFILRLHSKHSAKNGAHITLTVAFKQPVGFANKAQISQVMKYNRKHDGFIFKAALL